MGLSLQRASVYLGASGLAGGSLWGPSKAAAVVALSCLLRQEENYVELCSGAHIVPDMDITCYFISSANDLEE